MLDRQLSLLLDELAAESIREGSEEFELGLPIAFNDEAVSYKLEGPGLRGKHPDLLLRHYVGALGDRLQELTAETLRRHKISAEFNDDNRPPAKWPIRSALVGSLVYDNERYAANEGEWYRIEQSFKNAIESTFNKLVEEWESDPEPLRRMCANGKNHYEAEAIYNARFAATHGLVLLDRAMIKIPDVDRSEFESCDILDISGKRFIHLKKSSRRSSVLSHFFKQGANSARYFSMFNAAWTRLREIVVEKNGPEAGEQLDIARANSQKWKVEFIIADAPRSNGQFNIPFFSKVSLRDEIRAVQAMHYDAGLRFINLQSDI